MLKICIVGPANSGKSALLSRLAKDTFNTQYVPTIGVDYTRVDLELGRQKIKMGIWDLAGSDEHFSATKCCIHGAHAIVVTCDMSAEDGIAKTEKMWKVWEKLNTQNCSVFLVGTKTDLQQKVTQEELNNLAKKLGPMISTKIGNNVKVLFEEVANAASKQAKNTENSYSSPERNKETGQSNVRLAENGMFSSGSKLSNAIGSFLRALANLFCCCYSTGNDEEKTSEHKSLSNTR